MQNFYELFNPEDFEKVNALLDGKNSMASKFGKIRYYEDSDIVIWESRLAISDVFGIRTFWDLQQNQQKHGEEEWQAKMIQLEMRVSQIPVRTLEDWEAGRRTPPEYVPRLIAYQLKYEELVQKIAAAADEKIEREDLHDSL